MSWRFSLRNPPALFSAGCILLVAVPAGAQTPGDFLTPGVNLADPARRAEVVARMRDVEKTRRDAAGAEAVRRGWPRRLVRRDGRVMELMQMEGNRPVYAITHNTNAAISTGANLLAAAPFSLNGAGVTVGLWDGGSARVSHREFGGRVSAVDGVAAIDHATHVGGTIAAAGVDGTARGMATAVRVDSYDWTGDKSELTARGATWPGEPGKIYLSNHSYGFIAGWNYTGGASPAWDWWGTGTTSAAAEQDFGKYDTNARDSDALAAAAPWLLMVRSAGNDRYDNPSTGEAVALSAGGTTTVSYNPALHPPGDDVYKNGYDTLGYDAAGKNVLTVGSVSDAVSAGSRNAAAANLSGFSSCGPTDDGRIKPDVVANGENLYSSLSGSDSSYGTLSGTSMAAPNATGSAALLVNLWGQVFPGQAMRASTLKALLIHTATDRGVPGPDYQYGWGLLNVGAAAAVISSYQTNPGNRAVTEDRLTTAAPSRSYAFAWDGVSPLRATLTWTDAAGTATTTGDLRTARLVNNLDLKLTAPGGAIFSPYTMPWVGDWTTGKLSAAAVPGKNNTDNTEQVFVSAPASPGTWQAVVTVDGSLTGGVQAYSLILSGASPAVSAPPSLSGVSPAAGTAGPAVFSLTGSGFLTGGTARLTRSGEADIPLGGLESLGDTLKGRADLTGKPAGRWNVTVTNPDGVTSTLPNAFALTGPLWQDDLEGNTSGWTHGNSQGSIDNWALVTSTSHSAAHSFSAAGPSSTNINDLRSPVIAIPAGASALSLSFWHSYSFQSGRDGGVLEFSLDGGAWSDVTAAGSGAIFASGAYPSTFTNSGSTSARNPLAPRAAWTGSTSGFTQVVINLTDTARYAGRNLGLRWRLATNGFTASTGWAVDDLMLSGLPAPVNQPPAIITTAGATPAPVTGTSAVLSVAAGDDGGAAALTCTWSRPVGPAPVTFSVNGTASATTTTVTFTAPGDYTFLATISDPAGLTATSSTSLTVQATPTSLTLGPAPATLGKGDTFLFTAAAADQFGAVLIPGPPVSWQASGGGTIPPDGTFTATTTGGPYQITAATASLAASTSLTVTGPRLAAWKSQFFSGEEIAAGLAADDGDPDLDGFSNFVEYAFGTDPRATTPWLDQAFDAGGHLTLTLPLPRDLPDVRYFGEAGPDISTWDTPVPLEILGEGDPQLIRLTDPRTRHDSARRFLRLRAAHPD